ncbi:MAG: hypothetical protein ACRD2A_24115, partial [Vicinamibacterales bacterium]
AMHDCRVLAGGDARRWNRLVDKMQSAHLQLRETSQGRDGITSLIGDECLTVRQWSATNALAWAPLQARAELAREVEEGGPVAFEAQLTLREFDAGRLDTAWNPKA